MTLAELKRTLRVLLTPEGAAELIARLDQLDALQAERDQALSDLARARTIIANKNAELVTAASDKSAVEAMLAARDTEVQILRTLETFIEADPDVISDRQRVGASTVRGLARALHRVKQELNTAQQNEGALAAQLSDATRLRDKYLAERDERANMAELAADNIRLRKMLDEALGNKL